METGRQRQAVRHTWPVTQAIYPSPTLFLFLAFFYSHLLSFPSWIPWILVSPACSSLLCPFSHPLSSSHGGYHANLFNHLLKHMVSLSSPSLRYPIHYPVFHTLVSNPFIPFLISSSFSNPHTFIHSCFLQTLHPFSFPTHGIQSRLSS